MPSDVWQTLFGTEGFTVQSLHLYLEFELQTLKHCVARNTPHITTR